MSDPSAWLKRSVVLEGVLEINVNPPNESSPYDMVLSSGNQSIGVFWNGPLNTSSNGMVRVFGVISKGYDVITGIQLIVENNTYQVSYVNVVYYVEAQRIEPL